MTVPVGEPAEPLGYRHVRSLAGLVGMGLAIGAAVAIQVARAAHESALLAKGCPEAATVIPAGLLQFVYALAIPVGLPLVLFVFSVMLFSPTILGQVLTAFRGVLPGTKGPA